MTARTRQFLEELTAAAKTAFGQRMASLNARHTNLTIRPTEKIRDRGLTHPFGIVALDAKSRGIVLLFADISPAKFTRLKDEFRHQNIESSIENRDSQRILVSSIETDTPEKVIAALKQTLESAY